MLFSSAWENLLLVCVASSLVMTDGLKSHDSSSALRKNLLSARCHSRCNSRLFIDSRSLNVDRRKRGDTACRATSDSTGTDNSDKEFLAYTVDQVLDSISNTDKGASASKPLQKKVNAWMEVKSDEYRQSLSALNVQLGRVTSSNSIINDVTSSPSIDSLEDPVTVLDDENLFGNYDVTYVSTLKAAKQQGNPAGGNFRGSIGRFIYENNGLYQNIFREDDLTKEKGTNKRDLKNIPDEKNIPNLIKRAEEDSQNQISKSNQKVTSNGSSNVNEMSSNENEMNPSVKSNQTKKDEDKDKQSRIVVVNYISGKLFRFLTVSVILKGIIEKVTDNDRLTLTKKYGTVLSPGTVRADFDSPLITIGGIGIRIGPNSNVVLDTPYLDAKIRLGMGARGSSFIFKRTKEDNANNWKIDLQRKALPAKSTGIFLLFFGTLFSNLFTNCKLFFVIFARNFISVSSIFVGLLLFLTSGGIRVNDNITLEKKK